MGTKVVFATVQAVTSAAGKRYWTTDPMRKDVAMCLIDEAHQFGCDSYHTMDHELFPLAKFVGFSATPYRRNQYSFAQFDTVAYAIDSQSLIDQGYLVKPQLFQLRLEDTDTAERLASVIRVWSEREKHRGLVSVVYLRTTSEAQEMRLVAEEAGIKVDYVDGTMPDAFCRDLYGRARDGYVEMIVNVRKLETGIDIPNIGSVFMPFGTGSVVSYLQRIGRALRPCPGKSLAHVYVFGDAPSIERGQWKRVHDEALRAKKALDPIEKLQDELADLLEDTAAPAERIAWTKAAIEACERLTAGNLKGLADLIAEKKFPQKYARAIQDITRRIEADSTGPGEPLSDAQKGALVKRYGFDQDDVSKLGKNEATGLLGALSDFYARSPWILQSGPHAGKHIAETPPLYRKMIKDPKNKALVQRWYRAGRPENEA
jgi:superfamily II DNA or RNA helicase